MTNISEGLVLVSSDIRPNIKAKAGTDEAVTKPDVKNVGARKRPTPVGKSSSSEDSHVGQVLRTVYQRTVDEAIPSEMLDLLSKLG
jgi:hypothetical protein